MRHNYLVAHPVAARITTPCVYYAAKLYYISHLATRIYSLIITSFSESMEVNMYKIGMDARALLQPTRGMPLYVRQLTKLLPQVRPEWEFYLFVNSKSRFNAHSKDSIERLSNRKDNVQIIDCANSYDSVWEQFQVPRLMSEYQLDLFHFPCNRLSFFVTQKKQIATFHDAMEIEYIKKIHAPGMNASLKERLYFWRMKQYVKLIYKLARYCSTKTITVSSSAKKDLSNLVGIPTSKITAIHHGVNEAFTRQRDGSDHQSHKSGVLMLGGDGFQKNAYNAIAAWASLPNALKEQHKLTIAGFTGDCNSPIRKALRDYKCEANVTILGWVTESELIKLFRTHHAFLFLSIKEGFGFPLLQSMASELPTLCSDIAVFREIGQEAALYADPLSITDCSEKLSRLLQDHEMRSELIKAGTQQIQKFSWQITAKKHCDVFEEALQQIKHN